MGLEPGLTDYLFLRGGFAPDLLSYSARIGARGRLGPLFHTIVQGASYNVQGASYKLHQHLNLSGLLIDLATQFIDFRGQYIVLRFQLRYKFHQTEDRLHRLA